MIWIFIGWFLLALLFFVVISTLIAWVVISRETFTDIELQPGNEYNVAGRTYRFPKEVTVEGRALLLKTRVIQNLRNILFKFHDLCKEKKIGYHVTGTTLLGILRHQAIPMPFDDTISCCVDWEWRDFMFSEEFHQEAQKVGLETRFLPSNDLNRADVLGARVRLQLNDGSSETCDVYFWKENETNQLIGKVDSWMNSRINFNSKEQFQAEDVYPRRLIEVDEMHVFIPNNPRAILTHQFGQDVLTKVQVKDVFKSQAFPMRIMRGLFLSRPLT